MDGVMNLFVALGGTSYAVTRVPANSVGPRVSRASKGRPAEST